MRITNTFYGLFFYFFLGVTSLFAQHSLTKSLHKLMQPSQLKQGDTVAIVAPAGILKNRFTEIENAKHLLESWGLVPLVAKHVFTQGGHFAGTDEERCDDFQAALDNPKVKAIWCARGGYGSVRILDMLNFTLFKENPKWIIGYSDITALHSQVHNIGVESLHSIMGTSMTEEIKSYPESIKTFKQVLFNNTLKYELSPSNYNKIGIAKGELVGGNLAILASLLGSNSQLNTKGKILFIEEIGEYAYSIDRMLQSLKRAGYFKNCVGLIVGDMSKVKHNTTDFGKSVSQIILDTVAEYNFPVAFNMKAGHEPDNRALILGREIELKVTDKGSTIQF